MKFTSYQPKIFVVGSSSIDLVINTENYPKPNETVMATKTESFFGGKGANQAVATSRLGASVYFTGCVGMDPMGQQVLRNLVEEGVNVAFVGESEHNNTGTAYVTASENKNAIVVVPAANHDLEKRHIDNAEKYLQNADIILLQLEIPMNIVEHTVQIARKHKIPVGIYAAPAAKLCGEVLDYASFIVAKHNDLPTIFGNQSEELLLKKYPNKLFLRDETNCTTYFNGSEIKKIGETDIQIVNKMGMGDAFTSGFSVAYCHKNPIEECVQFGNKIALKVAENRGSQQGLPYLKDITS